MPSGRFFDALGQQDFLNNNAMGLRREAVLHEQVYPTSKMIWNWAGLSYGSIVLAWITGADETLTDAATRSTVFLAQYSLDHEEWRAWAQIIPDEEYVRWGKRSRIDHPDRAEAFITANLVLVRDHWVRTGVIDREGVARMFAQQMDVPAVRGVLSEHYIMPLSAWPEILALRDLPDPGGNKRPNDADRRIGQLLAEDPAQLHDPKSPIRKKARAHMRQSMSPRWLGGGLAVEALNWLQTFEWREGESGLSPREVMLRAYAYMPDVDPPANIAAEVGQLRKLSV